MEQFIGCDAHKKFSLFVTMNEKGEYGRAIRVGHDRQVFREFLQDLPPGSEIALETSGSYYWLVEERERSRTSSATGSRLNSQAADGGTA